MKKRPLAALGAVIATIATILVPATSAHASIYDSGVQSNLYNLANAMSFYQLLGPTGNYSGVTSSALAAQGWTRAAHVDVQIWIEGTGNIWRAVAQDDRGSTQYAFSSSGTFLGKSAGSVGATSPQPLTTPAASTLQVFDIANSIDAEALAAALAGIAVAKICDAVLFLPGTHQRGSSVSDQALACYDAAAASGATARSVLLAMRAIGGARMLEMIAAQFVGDGAGAASAPSWVDGSGSAPTTAPNVPTTLPPMWRLPKYKDQFQSEYGTTSSIATVIATQCLFRVAAIGTSKNSAYDECKSTPIFASGQTDVSEATEHDILALASNPAWVALHYRPSASNPAAAGWYNASPTCSGSHPGEDCDEYPFRATEENNGPGVDLALIDSTHNQYQGSLYSGFVTLCGLRSGTTSVDRAFFGIPIPAGYALPTLAFCDGAVTTPTPDLIDAD